MGTKNKPGKFDCYSKAEPDEPMFVLLGRDHCAPFTLMLWIGMRVSIDTTDVDDEKLAEAFTCMRDLYAWAKERKPAKLEAALAEFCVQLDLVPSDVRDLMESPNWVDAVSRLHAMAGG